MRKQTNTCGDLWIFPPVFVLVVSQDEVYREAVTEGYLIDGFFLSPRSTALPKRPEIAEASQQPSSQSKDSEVFDERLDAFHNVSTTEGVELHQSSQQPSTESKDNFEGSGDPIQWFITRLPDHGGERNASTTESAEVLQSTQKPTTESTDYPEGSGDPVGEFLSLQTTTQSGLHTQNSQKPYSETTESGTFEGSGDTTTQLFFPNGEHLTTTQSSTAVFMPGDFEGSASGEMSPSPFTTTQTGSVSSTYMPPPVIVLDPRLINTSLGQSLETQNPQPDKSEYTPQSGNGRTPGKSLDWYNIGDILARSRHCSSWSY